MDAIDRIEQAFLQLSFAIKLHFYVEDKLVEKKVFDREIKFKTLKAILPANQFNEYADIESAASNSLMIALGFSAMVLSESLDSRKSELKHDEKELRDLVYMIRCCFAHNATEPIWKVKSQYQKRIEIKLGARDIVVDLKGKNNTPFVIEDIGGYDGYFEIRDAAVAILRGGRKNGVRS